MASLLRRSNPRVDILFQSLNPHGANEPFNVTKRHVALMAKNTPNTSGLVIVVDTPFILPSRFCGWAVTQGALTTLGDKHVVKFDVADAVARLSVVSRVPLTATRIIGRSESRISLPTRTEVGRTTHLADAHVAVFVSVVTTEII